MKRKIFVISLIIFSCLFVDVYALKEDESTSASVKVGNVDAPIYSVDVTWGKMDFTYTEQINYVWDDINHTYDLGESTYRWAAKDNYVDVNNHSYDAISVELEYVSLEESVDGVFNISKTTIDSRSNNRFTLTLEGKLKDSGLEYIKVCSINLKLS